ncbi:hypothetical protein PA25_38870 [Pseudoalteromonas sp. A25]|uniref:hypothetical protein n=1 Tax=Pseudoalteromonas sp. A25 TaxID=116092 RepID=UPI0012A26602|nr:hypothetical protein [Pseudoalteromonas sp. A25]BBN83902.1 hypothetical protein PA25_38870 [Pseudoalteromonas sp. A25]
MSLFRQLPEQQLTLPLTFLITLLLLALTLFTFPSQAEHESQTLIQKSQCVQQDRCDKP